jgi:putative ABC transport system permease protein
MRFARVAHLAWKSLWLHRLRSLLTVLGIVFGVGSVVAMLAIGEGASQDAQSQIRRMGSRNLLLASVPPAAGSSAAETRSRILKYGILRTDLERILETVPGIARAVPRRDVPVDVRFGPRKFSTVVLGTEEGYADVANLRVASGRFLTAADRRERRPVCVLGDEAARRLFLAADPVGQTVRGGPNPYLVVGVLAPRGEGTGGTAGLGGESDAAVYVPLEALSERYGDVIVYRATGTNTREDVELHRITVEAATVEDVPRVASALRALVAQSHPGDDVRLTVPLELLRQAEETKRLFTVLLGSIAAISLLVGGIGIMNITLASVVERTREVGIRRALGARRSHIVTQFLAETVLLSVCGGLVGLLVGMGIPEIVSAFAKVSTVVTPFSLALAFGISAVVGILFGLYPAVRAADLDPVEALRHE